MKPLKNIRQIFGAILAATLLLGLALTAACGDNTTTIAPATTTVPATATASAGATAITTNAVPAATVATTPAPAVATATTVVITPATTRPASTVATAPTDVTPPPLGQAESVLKATGFDGEEARRFLDELTTQIGVRVVGSEGEKKAADWLEKYYKTFGYTQIDRQEFPVTLREVRSAAIFSGNQPGRDNNLSVGSLLSKPKTIQVTGPLSIYEEGRSLKGNVVFITGGGDAAELKLKVETVLNGGAIAVLLVPAAGPADYQTFAGVETPVLGISPGQIQTLEQVAKNDKNSEVTVTTFYQPGGRNNGQNVIATRPGPSSNAPILIFGGHYDTVAGTVGASDNGSGTVITMELAKVLFQKFPDYELRFINFSGEEIGLIGSTYYVSKLSEDEKKRLKAYINVDAVGVGDRFVAIGSQKLVGLAVDTANQNGIRLEAFNLEGTGAGSDHEAFTRKGLNAVMLGRWIDPQLHRPGDTANRVYPQALLLGGGVAILTAQKLVLSNL
jgi:aminopeptidase YwaD